MPKRTLALIVGLIVLTVVLLFAATRGSLTPKEKPSPQPSTSPQITVTPTPPAYTTLQLSPNPVTLSQNGTGSIQVLIDTNQNAATGVQLELSYDPNAITNVAVTPGTFFENPLILTPLNKIDQQNGRISHAEVLPPSQTGVKGKGVVATITFSRVTGTTVTQTQLEFLPKTLVTQSGINPSVLKTSTGTTIHLGTSSVNSAPQTNSTTPVQ